MNITNTWKIFRINDCQWYVARTIEEAVHQAESDSGQEVDMKEVCQISESSLDKLIFVDEEDIQEETTRSFRQELARRIEQGLSNPQIFASTQY